MLKKTFTNKLPKQLNTTTKARGFGAKAPMAVSLLALMGMTQFACAQISWPGSSSNYRRFHLLPHR